MKELKDFSSNTEIAKQIKTRERVYLKTAATNQFAKYTSFAIHELTRQTFLCENENYDKTWQIAVEYFKPKWTYSLSLMRNVTHKPIETHACLHCQRTLVFKIEDTAKKTTALKRAVGSSLFKPEF